jgi:hypothetical protein
MRGELLVFNNRVPEEQREKAPEEQRERARASSIRKQLLLLENSFGSSLLSSLKKQRQGASPHFCFGEQRLLRACPHNTAGGVNKKKKR